jgi:hypothetical protein
MQFNTICTVLAYTGKECGILLHEFGEVKKDDIIECYSMVEQKRDIDDANARGFVDPKQYYAQALTDIALFDNANASDNNSRQKRKADKYGTRAFKMTGNSKYIVGDVTKS